MSMNLDREKLKALAGEPAKDIKTEKDLNVLSAELPLKNKDVLA